MRPNLNDIKNQNMRPNDNLALWYHKPWYFKPEMQIQKDKKVFKNSIFSMIDNRLDVLIINKNHTKPQIHSNYKEIVSQIHTKQKVYLKSLYSYTIEKILKTYDKLSIGMGIGSIFETNLTMHPVYGLPYIPGSSIKGCLRSFLIRKHFENVENKALESKWFRDIFGNTQVLNEIDQKGMFGFMDAYPLDGFQVANDIMTPHYGDYYNKDKKEPVDTSRPNPIHFLVIKDSSFSFRIGCKLKFNITIDDKTLCVSQFLMNSLTEMLTTQGLGAKTAIGYGFFIEVKNP